jgi:hypothetical protein
MLPQTVVVQSGAQVSCPLRGEAAILNTTSGSYFGLQSVGARVWDLIASPKTIGELQETILTEYDVAPGQCDDDLRRFIGELADAGLVEVRDEPSENVSSSPAR